MENPGSLNYEPLKSVGQLNLSGQERLSQGICRKYRWSSYRADGGAARTPGMADTWPGTGPVAREETDLEPSEEHDREWPNCFG